MQNDLRRTSLNGNKNINNTKKNEQPLFTVKLIIYIFSRRGDIFYDISTVLPVDIY